MPSSADLEAVSALSWTSRLWFAGAPPGCLAQDDSGDGMCGRLDVAGRRHAAAYKFH
jgi:hypothetical protein